MKTEIAIVGAGPIGIELAVALKGEGIPYVHLEAGQVGTTIGWYAPQTRFFSSPERIAISGVPLQTLDQSKATREEYLLYLRTVVQQYDLQIRSYEPVDRIEETKGGFLLHSTAGGATHTTAARRVVLAIGDMHLPRTLGIPGEDLPHVSHYFEDPHRYFRRHVLIVGGKNSAVEAAIRCYRCGARVTLSYRQEDLNPKRIKFWLMPEIRAMIRDGSIEFLPSTAPQEILGDRVVLSRVGDGDRDKAGPTENGSFEVPADFVLLMTGYRQDSSLFEGLGLRLEGPGKRPWVNPTTMETSLPGVYVAGTASAGTQMAGVKAFIETSHIHVERILAAVTGRPPRQDLERSYELPES
ncbi:MAG: NAD(P)-binding domain-containing protein [Deltaproteobacteria bacterium]|nr:NAD(P)-binding domain-containing protein [Deltaproteobacteria bacterium]